MKQMFFAVIGMVILSSPLTGRASPDFVYTGSMKVGRFGQTATLLPGGNVLVAGGSIGSYGVYIAITELYNPASRSWVHTNSLNNGRYNHTATLLSSGRVLVAGGD